MASQASIEALDRLVRGELPPEAFTTLVTSGQLDIPNADIVQRLENARILSPEQADAINEKVATGGGQEQIRIPGTAGSITVEIPDYTNVSDLALTPEQEEILNERTNQVADLEGTEVTLDELLEFGSEEVATQARVDTALGIVQTDEALEGETPRFSIEPVEIAGRSKLLITDTFNPTEVQVLDPEEDALALQRMEQDVQQGALDLEFRGQQISLGKGEFLLNAISTLAQLEETRRSREATERAQAEQNRLAEIELLGEGGPGAFAVRQAIQAGQPTIATTGEVTAGGTRMPYEISSAVREILNLGEGDISLRPKSIVTEDLSRGTRLGTPEGEPEALEAQAPLNVLEAGGGQIGTINRDIQLGSALARLTPEDRVLIDELSTIAGLGGIAGLQTEAQKTSAPRGTGIFTTARS